MPDIDPAGSTHDATSRWGGVNYTDSRNHRWLTDRLTALAGRWTGAATEVARQVVRSLTAAVSGITGPFTGR
jgi:hypothetical protein